MRYEYAFPISQAESRFKKETEGGLHVQGCVNIPADPFPCQNDPRVDWRDWLALARGEPGFGDQGQEQFDDWSSLHVKFVHTTTANPRLVEEAVNGISSQTGVTYLLGFSAGGAAVLEYLQTLREQPTTQPPPIRGAVVLDSPVGDARDLLSIMIARYIDFSRLSTWSSAVDWTDRFAGLGSWCKAIRCGGHLRSARR